VVLHSVARNLGLEESRLDCDLVFTNTRGKDNVVVDLLFKWESVANPVARLVPVWCNIPVMCGF
jgi:hypothetical protein